MRKNSGQVLALFVILLPVFLLLLVILVNVGNIYLDKAKTKNTLREIIINNLNNYDLSTNERVNVLIEKNIGNIVKKEVFTSEDEIRINLIQEKLLFGRNLKLSYRFIGKKQDNRISVSEG